jgi:hypothetical protein
MPTLAREIMADHLRHNHVPPIPAAFADAANAAIEALEAGEPDLLITYGDGLAANGRSADRAADIADAMHLWDLVEDPEAIDPAAFETEEDPV